MPVTKKATKKITKKSKPAKGEPIQDREEKVESTDLADTEIYIADSENKPSQVHSTELNREHQVEGKERYFETVGRRKESTARVRLYTKKASDIVPENQGLIEVNNKSYQTYFSNKELQLIVEEPLKKLKSLNRFKAKTTVRGGGLSGQAEAIKHGIARALVEFDQNYKKKLRKAGLLTRDPREKERRKYGLKKARRAPQWSKR